MGLAEVCFTISKYRINVFQMKQDELQEKTFKFYIVGFSSIELSLKSESLFIEIMNRSKLDYY